MGDTTDNPGGGCYGDSTDLLIAANLQDTAFHAIFDPQAVQDAIAIGVGDSALPSVSPPPQIYSLPERRSSADR